MLKMIYIHWRFGKVKSWAACHYTDIPRKMWYGFKLGHCSSHDYTILFTLNNIYSRTSFYLWRCCIHFLITIFKIQQIQSISYYHLIHSLNFLFLIFINKMRIIATLIMMTIPQTYSPPLLVPLMFSTWRVSFLQLILLISISLIVLKI